MAWIVLTRDDANTESALLAGWLVGDEEEVKKGQAVCLVETTKATVEIDAPASGTLLHLHAEGAEVELGGRIALVAESGEELERERERREQARAEAPARPAGPANATRKAVELAEQHGIDLDAVEKSGFVTAEDVQELIERGAEAAPPAADPVLAGISTENVTLPALFSLDESEGRLDEGFLAELRADPGSFRTLPAEEKLAAYRSHGARVGDGVELGEGTLLVAPRIVLEDGVEIGPGGTVACDEVVAIGALSQFGPGLDLSCRRAFVGENVYAGRGVRIGGGGRHDPWATLVLGDLVFVGDEAFVNVCRPVLVGAEVFLTMRSIVVTHNVGHSLLEGFENRFAGVVLEDRSQIGMGTIVYAGCRVGRETIVGSGSYVVSDLPAGKLAIGVPARVAGSARRELSRPRRDALARRIVEELHELLELKGHEVTPLADEDGAYGFELRLPDSPARIVYVEKLAESERAAAGGGETIVLTLGLEGAPPAGCTVLDLLGREVVGGEGGGVVLDSVREFCRKRGIRFRPLPWRYRGGLI